MNTIAVPTNGLKLSVFFNNWLGKYETTYMATYQYCSDEHLKKLKTKATLFTTLVTARETGDITTNQRTQLRELQTDITLESRFFIQFMRHSHGVTDDILNDLGIPLLDKIRTSRTIPDVRPFVKLTPARGGTAIIIDISVLETSDEGIPEYALGALMFMRESNTPITDYNQLPIMEDIITRKRVKKNFRSEDIGKTFWCAFRFFNRHGIGAWSNIYSFRV
jgi:hypothetical protein